VILVMSYSAHPAQYLFDCKNKDCGRNWAHTGPFR
jgi:hypothetical protein